MRRPAWFVLPGDGTTMQAVASTLASVLLQKNLLALDESRTESADWDARLAG